MYHPPRNETLKTQKQIGQVSEYNFMSNSNNAEISFRFNFKKSSW